MIGGNHPLGNPKHPKAWFAHVVFADAHVEKINVTGMSDETLRRAAAKLPKVDAIGGSAAGVYVDNQPRIASLFRGIPEKDFASKVRPIFLEVAKEFPGAPFVVLNDGEVTALAGAIHMSGGRSWGAQWYDGEQVEVPDYRAPGNLPRMEVGHMGVMYRIFTEAIRNNPVFLMHGTSKECNTEDTFYTSARIGTQVYAYRKACKERQEPFLGIFGGKKQIEGETEYVVSTDGRGRYCLIMVNTKPEKQVIRVTMPGHQFAAPMYRTLTCPEKYLDCRAVPGEGQPWRQISWEDTQSGFVTWSNWDSKEGKPGHCSYTPLPSGVDPKCDDMIVEIEPHTVQSVEFYVRKQPVAK